MADRHARWLGMDRSITRRDFLNATTLGTGAGLLAAAAPLAIGACRTSGPDAIAAVGPDWYGPGGLGDYASSHGNTPEVVTAAHRARDGGYLAAASSQVHDTGEEYDVVIVGAGMAGLGALYEFTKARRPGQRCLIVDNHPVFGGESKRNEIDVEGVRLIGPQGANGFSTPAIGGTELAFADGDARYYQELGVPREFTYSVPRNASAGLAFGRDNYGFIYWLEHQISSGHFFRRDGQPGVWVKNPFQAGFGEAPIPAEAAASVIRLVTSRRKPFEGGNLDRWLDGLSYKQVIEEVLGYPSTATAHLDPIVAASIGLGCDAISAYGAYADAMPGFLGYYGGQPLDHRHSFPGGNDGFARYFVKATMPWAIEGEATFEAILNGRIRFEELDRPTRDTRMRLGATVVAVVHDGPPESAAAVIVTLLEGGALRRFRARGVVMATGGWVNRYVVTDLPPAYRSAYATFVHAPFLVANVALRHWRFLDRLGITACRYQGEFGFSCNLRQPMQVGDYQPPLDPDRPALLTFYVPFYYPGHPPKIQGTMGRAELLSVSFPEYERRIRVQMQELFGATGFDAARDIAGIILNRWGHAYVAPGPGFYFGRGGLPAARDVVRQRHGRIAFGHSELRGNQHWGPAADEGARAVRQVLEVI